MGASLAGGDENGDRIAGGCISLIAALASGLFLGLTVTGLGSWVCCGGRMSLGLCCGWVGLLGAEDAATIGVVTFSGENSEGGRVL